MRTVLVFHIVLFIITGSKYCKGDDDCTHKTSHLAPVRLKKDLLCDYDKTIRPVLNHANVTTVNIRMVLKFFTYEMHTNTISVHNWLAVYWIDEHLKWNPDKYESIKEIHLSSDEIWMPDLSVYNRNDQSGSPSALTSVDCLVTSTGSVACVPPARHDALCMPNIAKYPFDRQNCSLRYGSWVHSGEEIDFKLPTNPVTMEDYIPNGDWKLITVSVKKFPGHFNCCPDNSYPSLNYNFLIERHSATHAATVVIPAVVMIMLTLTTLWMNPEQLDRLCLACCNFIAHSLYLETLSWQIPSSGDQPPLLILFARDSLLLCAFSIVFTVFLKAMIASTTSSPLWISTIISGVLSNRPGQFLLLYDMSLKSIATAKGEEDGANIINDATAAPTVSKDWQLFAKLLDRLSFIAFLITYLCMFMAFVL